MSEQLLKKHRASIDSGGIPYRLRNARYYEIGLECAQWSAEHYRQTGQRLKLIDVGSSTGVLRRYIEMHPDSEHIEYAGVDIFPRGKESVYKHEDWNLYECNLEEGMPSIESDQYDVVVCEQVLEHLHHPDVAIKELHRILKPGGRLVIGVPIFPPGLDLVRKHIVPITDRMFKVKKERGHVQGWSRGSFLRLLQRTCPDLTIEDTRGFRIVSGGILKPLEYHRWWWQLNRRLGAAAPALCIELQAIARKPGGESGQAAKKRAA